MLVLLLLLSACTSGGGSKASDTLEEERDSAVEANAKSGSDDATAKVDELILFTADTKEELQRELYKPFEDEYKVKIKIIAVDSKKYVENFMAAHNAKQPIDVVGLNGQDVRFFASTGIIKDLSESVTFTDRFHESALAPYQLAGSTYAIPTGSMGTSGLFYNKKLFEENDLEPPKTYEDILNIAAKLKDKKISAIAFGGATTYMWPMWFFQTFAQTSGNQSVERTIATLKGEAKFTDPDYVEAMEILQRFGQDNLFQPGVNGVDSAGGIAVFSTGKAAMFYGGSWEYGGFAKTEKENSDKFTIGIVPFPIVDSKAEKPQQTGGSGMALGIYANIAPEKEQLAMKFIDFLSSDEVNKLALSKGDGLFSVNKNVKSEDPHQVVKDLTANHLPQTVTFLDWYYPPEVTKGFQDNLQAVVGGQKEPVKALEDIQKIFDDLVAGGYLFDK
jgi:raffinose/stachyose/melibiose transport system substrate-binding protein